jgi:hypothetical protein
MRSKISSIVANLPTAILFISSNSLTHNYPAKIFMPFSSRRFKWTSKGDPSAISLTAVFQQIMAASPSPFFERVSKRLTRISKPRVSSPRPMPSDPKINTFLLGSFKISSLPIKNRSMPFPIDEGFLHIHHGIRHQFHKASVVDAIFLPQIIAAQNISNGTFAVGTRRAHIFSDTWI